MRGGLALNKPKGPSSFDVIRGLRRVLPKSIKLGHAGTLDPAAQGLLLVLVAEATRIQHLVKDLDKEYRASVRLGLLTDTLDAEGTVVEETEVPPLEETRLCEVLCSLVGERMQQPPRYSALKIEGRRAYERAREGEDFRLPPRKVTIHEIELLSWHNPLLEIRTRVSSGTYIRSLAMEIGEKLGLPASLAALERTRIGRFELMDAIPIEGLTLERVSQALIPLETLLSHLPQERVEKEIALRLLEGKPVSEGIPRSLLAAPRSLIFSLDSKQAFLCKVRDGKLWSERLIYNNGASDV